MKIKDPKRFIVYNQKDRAGIFCTIEDAISYIDTQNIKRRKNMIDETNIRINVNTLVNTLLSEAWEVTPGVGDYFMVRDAIIGALLNGQIKGIKKADNDGGASKEHIKAHLSAMKKFYLNIIEDAINKED